MANLTTLEKSKLESFLRMDRGYVADFSDRTIQSFFLTSVKVDIHDESFLSIGTSKANKLRAFWLQENDYIVAQATSDLIDYWKHKLSECEDGISADEQDLYLECARIVQKLKGATPIEQIDAIQANNDDKDFNKLSALIREGIENNQPEASLDRLHTFVVKYTRELCKKHCLPYEEKEPLHAIFGKYVKYLTSNHLIESEMTERILKSSISVIEHFNFVRNRQSFAHDNPILNYDESVLIFNQIASTIRFVEAIESKMVRQVTTIPAN